MVLGGVLAGAGLAAAEGGSGAAGEPAVPRVVIDAGRKIPSLPTETTEANGRIASSTRGHKGPVRLRIEREGAGPLDVLMPADEDCQRLGLGLVPGSSITVRGSLLAGRNPILVAREAVVDGRTIDLRAGSQAGPTRMRAEARRKAGADEHP